MTADEVSKIIIASGTFIAAVAGLIASVSSLVISLLNRKNIAVVKKQTDGLMTIIKAGGHAEGKIEEIEYQRVQAEAHPPEPTKVEIVKIPEILPGIAEKEPVKVEITKIPPIPGV